MQCARQCTARSKSHEIEVTLSFQVIHEKPDDPYTFLSNEIMKHVATSVSQRKDTRALFLFSGSTNCVVGCCGFL